MAGGAAGGEHVLSSGLFVVRRGLPLRPLPTTNKPAESGTGGGRALLQASGGSRAGRKGGAAVTNRPNHLLSYRVVTMPSGSFFSSSTVLTN